VGYGHWPSESHWTHWPNAASQKCPGDAFAQSRSAAQLTQMARDALHVGALVGHPPPSAQDGTHRCTVGSHSSPAEQSPATPHWTHRCSDESQRGTPG
jgi:hypothetical protein